MGSTNSSNDAAGCGAQATSSSAFASLRTMSTLSNISDPFVKALTSRRGRAESKRLGKIHQKVLGLLDTEWPSLKNSSLLGTWRQRESLMRSIGPPMLLLHWETIAQLGRIPRSSEGRGISMEQAAAIAAEHKKRFFIEMFSHRWCSQGQMDDEAGSKASVLIQWAKYRWSIGLATFFWVDYTCIDQDDIAPGVCMLPLYVASCNNIICYDTPEYEPRAWCRVERLLFTAFVAPNNEFIGPDFTFDPSAPRLPSNELKPQSEECAALPDPESGQLTNLEDSELIRELKSLCAEHWGKCWKDGLLKNVDGKLEGVRSLSLGLTQVRLRRFASSPTAKKAALLTVKAQEQGDDVSTAPASDADDLELVTPQVSLRRNSSGTALPGAVTHSALLLASAENQIAGAPLGLVSEEEEDLLTKTPKLENMFSGVPSEDENNAEEVQLLPKVGQHDYDLLSVQTKVEEKESLSICGIIQHSENVQVGVEEFDDIGVAKASPHEAIAVKPWATSMFFCGPATAVIVERPQQGPCLHCC